MKRLAELIFRKMTEEDWDAFHEFDMTVFPDDAMSEEFFFRLLERDRFFSLDLDGEIIGQLVVAPFGENEGHLGRVAIAQRHQGKGYGKILMQKAMDWFKKENLVKVHLNTQDHNSVAQGLYKQFGFERTGTTWHYFVPIETLNPKYEYACQPILPEEIEQVGEKYSSLPAIQIRRLLEYPENPVLTLKDKEGIIKGVCRFTPSFPGCFPFEIDDIDAVDDFLIGLKPYSLPTFNYYRITFYDNENLAQMFEEREYKLHHRLYKMTAILS